MAGWTLPYTLLFTTGEIAALHDGPTNRWAEIGANQCYFPTLLVLTIPSFIHRRKFSTLTLSTRQASETVKYAFPLKTENQPHKPPAPLSCPVTIQQLSVSSRT
jgi:hypothetical protein